LARGEVDLQRFFHARLVARHLRLSPRNLFISPNQLSGRLFATIDTENPNESERAIDL
jgi:hypothetical protein